MANDVGTVRKAKRLGHTGAVHFGFGVAPVRARASRVNQAVHQGRRTTERLRELKAISWLLIPVLVVGSIACHREAVDETPDRLVQEFIERAKTAYGDQKGARAAFELLWSTAQKNLTERAARASALANRKVAPEEMLALTKLSLRFVPRRYAAAIQGDMAVVAVSGDNPTGDRADIRCVREQGRWRVVIDLPPLAPIQRRPDATSEDE